MDHGTAISTGMRTFETLIRSLGFNMRVFMLAETDDERYIIGDPRLRSAFKRGNLVKTGNEVDLGPRASPLETDQNSRINFEKKVSPSPARKGPVIRRVCEAKVTADPVSATALKPPSVKAAVVGTDDDDDVVLLDMVSGSVGRKDEEKEKGIEKEKKLRRWELNFLQEEGRRERNMELNKLEEEKTMEKEKSRRWDLNSLEEEGRRERYKQLNLMEVKGNRSKYMEDQKKMEMNKVQEQRRIEEKKQQELSKKKAEEEKAQEEAKKQMEELKRKTEEDEKMAELKQIAEEYKKREEKRKLQIKSRQEQVKRQLERKIVEVKKGMERKKVNDLESENQIPGSCAPRPLIEEPGGRAMKRPRLENPPTLSSAATSPKHVFPEAKRQADRFAAAVKTRTLCAEVERFKRNFVTPDAYAAAARDLVAAMSMMNTPNILQIMAALFAVLPPVKVKSLFDTILRERLVKCSFIELCLGLEYLDSGQAGAILLDAFGLNQPKLIEEYLALAPPPVAVAASTFLGNQLGSSYEDKVEAVTHALGIPDYRPEPVSDDELIDLINAVCKMKNISFPKGYLSYQIPYHVDLVTTWFRNGAIERAEASLYFERFLGDVDDVIMKMQVVETLAGPFPALAHWLFRSFKLNAPPLKAHIMASLPNSLSYDTQVCVDNAVLHEMVSSPGMHQISNMEEWEIALKTLRSSTIIAIVPSEVLNPTSPSKILGCVGFFAKRSVKEKVGNLYFIHPGSSGKEMTDLMFKDLAKMYSSATSSRILIFGDEIFNFPHFDFLRAPSRFLLDVGGMAELFGGEASIDYICGSVTGGPICNRGTRTHWHHESNQLFLEHLGMQCVLLMEYCIQDSERMRSSAVTDLRRKQMAEWQDKFGF